MKIIAFFGNKAGTGTSLLVHHLAWMYAKLGHGVLAADLDPQAGLTECFLDEKRLEQLWGHGAGRTVYDAFLSSLGVKVKADSVPSYFEDVADGLALLPGDLSMGGTEDDLAAHWGCRDGCWRGLRATAGLSRAVRGVAREANAPLILIDAGSNLDAIARAAMLIADEVVVTVTPSPAGLHGLSNFGRALRRWRREWREQLSLPSEETKAGDLPPGAMGTPGYVVWQSSLRLDRPITRRLPWLKRIPGDYRRHVLDEGEDLDIWVDDDPYCIGKLTYYLGLMPIAHDARKPVFDLKPGDGVIRNHMELVVDRYREYRDLAQRLAERCGLPRRTDF